MHTGGAPVSVAKRCSAGSAPMKCHVITLDLTIVSNHDSLEDLLVHRLFLSRQHLMV